MAERIWHLMRICDDEPDFNFTDPYENDYWDRYSMVIETIAGISIQLTSEDGEDIHQVYAELPLVFEEWEDEE